MRRHTHLHVADEDRAGGAAGGGTQVKEQIAVAAYRGAGNLMYDIGI
ncbi:MAG: hypothetical protein GVY09_00895 [Gammaproteobacteria bacterium]|jgi:hypothetical protein|nr:hypothetical protein [Gammaproteobacteria bacterium]